MNIGQSGSLKCAVCVVKSVQIDETWQKSKILWDGPNIMLRLLINVVLQFQNEKPTLEHHTTLNNFETIGSRTLIFTAQITQMGHWITLTVTIGAKNAKIWAQIHTSWAITAWLKVLSRFETCPWRNLRRERRDIVHEILKLLFQSI